jgi:hypothetical protein
LAGWPSRKLRLGDVYGGGGQRHVDAVDADVGVAWPSRAFTVAVGLGMQIAPDVANRAADNAKDAQALKFD